MEEILKIDDLVDTFPENPDAGLVGRIDSIYPDGTLSVILEVTQQEFPYRPDDVKLFKEVNQ
ncbi:hypothetical protein [Mucilaginibacter lappiensis]|uniref:DUF4926 domain-containing protein n=1 Tax=Mucilaginibacter lappiensis TaxID=354630 RepID=A0A841JG11_9SPHI|nr:hypothetical protein [Mucilaginibacter lappiensis]MBB6126971.1 hypothetical protein [Mucilaginibacter lappiensis]